MKEFSDSQKWALAADKVFCDRVSNDPELRRLETIPERTPDDRLAEVAIACGGLAQIGPDVYLRPPTAGTLLLLATVDSPYVRGGTHTLLDVDVAAFLLTEGRGALEVGTTVADIHAAAAGWADTAGVDRVRADSVIRVVIGDAFRGMEHLAGLPQTGQRCLFDLAWFAWFTATVATETGQTAEDVAWSMPLALATYYVVSHRQRQGARTLVRTPKEQMLMRLKQLMRERIAEMGYAHE